MSLARPPIPPPRRNGPPPPPPRRTSTASKTSDVEPEINAPTGIAARIASLQLNQVGRSPMAPTRRKSQPIEPETEEEEEEEAPPPPPPRRNVPPQVPRRRPTWEDIEARGADFARAISRKPPPIPSAKTSAPPSPPPVPGRRLPPMPTRLPTPPPEPEPESAYEPSDEGYASQGSETTCIKCHDFSFVDDHAAQFPRHTVTSLEQLAYDLTSPWESETEKFRAIFTWLHHNIAYDAESFFCGNVQASTAESTLRSGLAVCDGYAGLFMSLAELSGLQAMKVTGHGKGFGYIATEAGGPVPQYQGNHAWNCALMDGEWRLIDSCWGSGALEGSSYTKRFAPIWFTSSNADFGKRHYPEDPGYQLMSEEEGGPVSWESYILEPESPIIFNDLYEHDFSPYYVQPSVKYIQGGTRASFHLFKQCEHMSTAEGDNFVYFIALPDQNTRIPMTVNAEGGWSANVYVPSGGGDLSLFFVATVNGNAARGLGVQGFNQANGRKAMSFGGLCRWTVV